MRIISLNKKLFSKLLNRNYIKREYNAGGGDESRVFTLNVSCLDSKDYLL